MQNLLILDLMILDRVIEEIPEDKKYLAPPRFSRLLKNSFIEGKHENYIYLCIYLP